jgi:two-component system chemotaxis response regulator CheB
MSEIRPPKNRIDAVVIGASAGGIEAMSALLPPLPATFRPPIFIVLHLLRGRQSFLAEIFQPKCALKITEVEDGEAIKGNTVYFAPPDYHLLINDEHRLSLSVDDLVNYSRPSIDVLFESAADVFGDRLMGVILTGANSDGAKGLAAVKKAGGIAVVQRADEAAVSTMISSALEKVKVDYELPLRGIVQLLQSLDCNDTQPRSSIE